MICNKATVAVSYKSYRDRVRDLPARDPKPYPQIKFSPEALRNIESTAWCGVISLTLMPWLIRCVDITKVTACQQILTRWNCHISAATAAQPGSCHKQLGTQASWAPDSLWVAWPITLDGEKQERKGVDITQKFNLRCKNGRSKLYLTTGEN